MIELSELKMLLEYNPLIGKFTNKKKPHKTVGSYDRDGYLTIYLKGKDYRAARLAWFYMTGDWPTGQIDHINRIPSDDRWENLRDVTPSENLLNRNRWSKFPKGVTLLANGKFQAQWYDINKRKTTYLGLHNNLEEALGACKKFNEVRV